MQYLRQLGTACTSRHLLSKFCYLSSRHVIRLQTSAQVHQMGWAQLVVAQQHATVIIQVQTILQHKFCRVPGQFFVG